PHAASSSAGPRLPPPAKFAGRPTDIDRFLREMEQYMDYYAMTDPQRRVQLPAAFFADAAAVWWASLKSTQEDQLDAQGDVIGQVSAQSRITDWDAMKQALRGRFRPYMATTVARAALE